MKPPSPTIREADRAGFTPEPWTVIGDAGHPTNARITSADRPHIAKVYADHAGPDPVCVANAALIAAGPTMYRALAKIERLSAPGQELDLRAAIDVLCDVWNAARSALALAQPKADQGET